MKAMLSIAWVFGIGTAPALAACLISKRVWRRYDGRWRQAAYGGLFSLAAGALLGTMCLLIELELVRMGNKLSPGCPHGATIIALASIYAGGLGFAMPFLDVLYKRSRYNRTNR